MFSILVLLDLKLRQIVLELALGELKGNVDAAAAKGYAGQLYSFLNYIVT